MKWFKRIFIGLVGLYLLALGLDIFISKSLLNSSLFADELKIWNKVFKKNIKNEDVLFFGSSRAEVNIDPNIIHHDLNISAFNYGYNGQRLPLINYRIEQSIKNKETKNIVLVLDNFTFQKDYIFKIDHLSPIILYNIELYKLQSDIGYYNLVDIYIPLVRYFKNNEDFNWLHNVYKVYAYSQTRIYRELGYRKNNKVFNSNLINNKNSEIKFDKKVFELLSSLSKSCNKNNINLIFVTAPTHSKELDRLSNHDEIVSKIARFAKLNEILYLDYSRDESFIDDKYYADVTHLNAKGADIFTKKLAQDIKPYLK